MPGVRHYWEKKATGTPAAFLNPSYPHPPRLILAKVLECLRWHDTASGCWGSTRIARALHYPPHSPKEVGNPETKVTYSQRRHTALQWIKGIFPHCHTTGILEPWVVQEALCQLLENNRKISSYQPTKEESLLIIIYILSGVC